MMEQQPYDRFAEAILPQEPHPASRQPGRRKWLLPCLLTLLLAACTNRFTVPSDVLDPEDMQQVLWDMILADRFSAGFLTRDTTVKDLKAANLAMYERVFQLHKTSREEFIRSYKYYLTRPDLTHTMFDSIAAFGTRARDTLNKRRQDSLDNARKKDSALLKKDSLRTKADSLRARTDSLRKADSLKLRTDSLRRADSLKARRSSPAIGPAAIKKRRDSLDRIRNNRLRRIQADAVRNPKSDSARKTGRNIQP